MLSFVFQEQPIGLLLLCEVFVGNSLEVRQVSKLVKFSCSFVSHHELISRKPQYIEPAELMLLQKHSVKALVIRFVSLTSSNRTVIEKIFAIFSLYERVDKSRRFSCRLVRRRRSRHRRCAARRRLSISTLRGEQTQC
jgi:hypothetical protein